MNYWDGAAIFFRLCTLLSMAAVVGGTYSLYLASNCGLEQQRPLARYTAYAAACGSITNLIHFMLLIGAINQDGLDGMFDMDVIAILAASGAGCSTGLRLLAFLAALSWVRLRPERLPRSDALLEGLPTRALAFGTCAALAASFALTGHASILATPARAAVAIHALSVLWWAGALWPLLYLSNNPDTALTERLMYCFGRQALVIVMLLLVTGGLVLSMLLDSYADLLFTAYGRIMLIKFTGFLGMLSLAAANKLLLVPGLVSGATLSPLQRSIRMELVLALMLLALATYLGSSVPLPDR